MRCSRSKFCFLGSFFHLVGRSSSGFCSCIISLLDIYLFFLLIGNRVCFSVDLGVYGWLCCDFWCLRYGWILFSELWKMMKIFRIVVRVERTSAY